MLNGPCEQALGGAEDRGENGVDKPAFKGFVFQSKDTLSKLGREWWKGLWRRARQRRNTGKGWVREGGAAVLNVSGLPAEPVQELVWGHAWQQGTLWLVPASVTPSASRARYRSSCCGVMLLAASGSGLAVHPVPTRLPCFSPWADGAGTASWSLMFEAAPE